MNFVILQKRAISMGIWSETRFNPIEDCKQLNNTLKNSSQKLKGAANPFVLFADS